MEQRRCASSAPLRPRLLVPPQLPHRLRLPHVQQRRRFRLHYHQRDTVDEEHEVGDDHALVVVEVAALVAAADPELRGDDELVETALGVVEVEEADDARSPAARTIDDQRHPVGEILVDGLVAGHARGVNVLQLEDDAVGLLLRHPLVQAPQRPAQPPFQQDLALVPALRCQRLTGDVRPPQVLQQPPGRVLRGVELVELGGAGHEVSEQCA